MKRTLVLLRHAKASWAEDVRDHERPLEQRGREDAPVAGRWLRDNVPDIDVVVCSTALRTQQTWELAAAEFGGSPTLVLEPRIYAATVGELFSVVHDLTDDVTTALLIGHNPGLSELVWELSRSEFGLKTAGIAVLRGEGGWLDVAPNWAELVESVTPRS